MLENSSNTGTILDKKMSNIFLSIFQEISVKTVSIIKYKIIYLYIHNNNSV